MNKTTKTRILMENFTNYFSGNKKVIKENVGEYKFVTSKVAVAIQVSKHDLPDFYPASDELIYISNGQSLYLNDMRTDIKTTINPDPYSESAPDDAPRYTGQILEKDFVEAYVQGKNVSYQDVINYIMQTGKIANDYILKNVV